MIGLKMLATCGGIGYLKGGGTVAALLFAIVWWLLAPLYGSLPVQVVVFLVLLFAGIYAANKLELIWGKDSSRIVLDEAVGMSCSLLWVGHRWPLAVAALLLFRFFDIVKPLFISKAEKLPGGWGVMADDVAAGICANVVVQLLMATNVL